MIRKVVKVLWIFIVLVTLACVIIFFSIAKDWIGYMPPAEDLGNPSYRFAVEILSEDGKVLGIYSHSKENRVFVGYSDLSPRTINVLIVTEDVRSAEHSDIDTIALFRIVMKRGVLTQRNAGGGSIISQQLSKQLYSLGTDNAVECLFQKPIEWVTVIKLKRCYTKEETLTMYLNKLNFLNNVVGVKIAAYTYFDYEPRDPKIKETVILVGMRKNPSPYDLARCNERPHKRRNVVLSQMRKAGYITVEERDSLQVLPLKLLYHHIDHNEGLATYFREHLRGVLNTKKPNKSDYRGWQMQRYYEDSLNWETDPLYGWYKKSTKKDDDKHNLYMDGLKVYTAIDSRTQRYVEDAVVKHLKELQGYFFKEGKGAKKTPYTPRLTQEQVDKILGRAMRLSDRHRITKDAGAPEAEIKRAPNTPEEMSVSSWNGEKDIAMAPVDLIRYHKFFLRVGSVLVDPRNGHVKAYVGGPDHHYFKYDMAMVRCCQVGSIMRPYVCSLAVENELSPCDQARHVGYILIDEDRRPWTPRNANNKCYGEMVTVR